MSPAITVNFRKYIPTSQILASYQEIITEASSLSFPGYLPSDQLPDRKTEESFEEIVKWIFSEEIQQELQKADEEADLLEDLDEIPESDENSEEIMDCAVKDWDHISDEEWEDIQKIEEILREDGLEETKQELLSEDEINKIKLSRRLYRILSEFSEHLELFLKKKVDRPIIHPWQSLYI